jgi:pimeloyl-ACP methyl ester carboxylesterase
VTATAYTEGSVEANGRRLRYVEAGLGVPLVHLQPVGELRRTSAHDLLSRHFRVLLVETPGVGDDDAGVVAAALATHGVETFNLLASGVAAEAALRLARRAPERVLAVVLETPPAIPSRGREDPAARTIATLVLIGTRAGAAGAGRVVAERIPGCQLVFVYDAGPAIAVDRPEAFAEVVTDFLERHEAFVISRAETVIYP